MVRPSTRPRAWPLMSTLRWPTTTPWSSPSANGPLIAARDDQRLIAGLRTRHRAAVNGRRSMLIPGAGLRQRQAGGTVWSGPTTPCAPTSRCWVGRTPTVVDLARPAPCGPNGGGALDLVTGSGAPLHRRRHRHGDDRRGRSGCRVDRGVHVERLQRPLPRPALERPGELVRRWARGAPARRHPAGFSPITSGDHNVDAWVVTLAMTRD